MRKHLSLPLSLRGSVGGSVRGSLGGSLGCLLGGLILSSTCLAQSPKWVQVQTKNSPGARWQQGNSYDMIRGRTVIFGGNSASVGNMNDTWEYDGKDWTQMNPKTKPPGRRLVSMSFHLARAYTLMFGGATVGVTANLNDTWAWNGQDWKQLNPKTKPPVRIAQGMAYDSARARTVMVGGFTPSFSGYDDTWEWDGVDWTQIQTKNKPPAGARGIAYDAARRRIVLFGGSGYINETWEYDGKDWMKMNPTASPPGHYYVAMRYDSARKRIVIFGGLMSSGLSGQTWEYDGKTWIHNKTATQIPARRDYDQMVYDSRRQRMVVYGGVGAGGRLADTWEYVAPQSFTGTPSTISIATGGTQTWSLDAGTANASRLYWVFGSVTGTSPGVTLASPAGSVNIPLNPDVWTDITIGLANSVLLTRTRGILGTAGKGAAAFNVPKVTNQSAIGLKFYHAFLVYDGQGNFYMASNPVELMLVK